MRFKYPTLATEFTLLDKRAQVVVYAIDGYCRHNFGVEITVTSVYRPESPTHSRYCALDVRVEPDEGEAIFTDAQIIELKQFSEKIVYDTDRPTKPTIYVHPNKSGKGKHIHIQSFPGKSETILMR